MLSGAYYGWVRTSGLVFGVAFEVGGLCGIWMRLVGWASGWFVVGSDLRGGFGVLYVAMGWWYSVVILGFGGDYGFLGFG